LFQEERLITFESVLIYHIVNKTLWWKFEEISIVFNLMKNCVRTIVEGFQILITLGLKVLEFHVKLDLVNRGKRE
jgi:hypothetical protein